MPETFPHDRGWIGVDLDGTLAFEPSGIFDITVIGAPVPAMLARVCALLDAGEDVRIFTARVGPHRRDPMETVLAERAIKAWCLRYIGCELPVTATKDWRMRKLYDDRAVTVERDTGRVLTLDGPDAAAASCVVCDGTGIVAGALVERVHVLHHGKTLCGYIELPYGDRWVGLHGEVHTNVTCRACKVGCGCTQCAWPEQAA